jgi:hypothetical protein
MAEMQTLVLEFSVWVLQSDPAAGLRLFSSLTPPLPLSVVLPHVKQHAPEVAMGYVP